MMPLRLHRHGFCLKGTSAMFSTCDDDDDYGDYGESSSLSRSVTQTVNREVWGLTTASNLASRRSNSSHRQARMLKHQGFSE